MDKEAARLIKLVAGALQGVGVTRRELDEIAEKEERIFVMFPPLFTSLTFGGIALSSLLEVKVDLDIESFVSVYESFIATYVMQRSTQDGAPDAMLRRELKLEAHDAARLFGRGRRGRSTRQQRDMLLLLVPLATIALWTFGGDVESGPSQFVVSAGGYRFGLMSGQPVTNLQPLTVPQHVIVNRNDGALVDMPRGPGLFLRMEGDTLAQLFVWACRRNLETEAGLRLALLVLLWRCGKPRSVVLEKVVVEEHAPESWETALKCCRNFEDFADPYREIRRVFVPNLMTKDEFVKQFGALTRRNSRPGKKRREMWQTRLRRLQELHCPA